MARQSRYLEQEVGDKHHARTSRTKEKTMCISNVQELRQGRFAAALLCASLLVFLLGASCTSKNEQSQPEERSSSEPVVVTAPVAGVIRAVLVDEDAAVNQGAPILEISIPPESGNQKQTNVQNETGVKPDLKLAETEAARAQTKVQQVQDLFRRGYASQAELDTARTNYQDAQKRLQQAREASSETRTDQSKPGASPGTIAVLAPSSGRVHIISAQAGQPVRPGQELIQIEKSTE
ncbi:MAG: hypothetical protein DMF61_14270 [Blastocatellia bacterium AA13]|nr:MAG: hypothetical protein DMF61_14270 [Blastocatellia bacterium AA13]